MYLSFIGVENFTDKKELLEQARAYIQTQFRMLEISDHFYKLKDSWKLPDGPLLISCHFEWLTGGSLDGWLQATIETNLDPVLSVVREIIARKKGDLWVSKYEEIARNTENRNGNSTMVRVFLLREWAKMYKEKPHKILFLEGEDPIEDVSSQPHIHIALFFYKNNFIRTLSLRFW